MEKMSENSLAVSPAGGFWASKKKIERYTRIFTFIVLGIGAITMLFPIVWMISTSFKEATQVFAIPPVWIPNPLHWENYPKAWNISGMYSSDISGFLSGFYTSDDGAFLGIKFQGINFTTYFFNTLTISVLSCLGTTISSSVVAFAFARLRFPGRGPLFLLCLATMMVPPQVTMIPSFILFKSIGWYNTFYPLIVPAFLGGGAYNIFLMRQFFMSIPYEMDEAAKIDGCTDLGVYWRILMPLCKPALTTVAVFSFVWNWNDFLNPLIYLDSNSKKPWPWG